MKTLACVFRLLVGVALASPPMAQILWAQDAVPQFITWTGTTNATLALNTPYPLGAVSSSGLPVVLRVSRGPAVLVGGTITVTNLDTVVVTAEQAGDSRNLPAHSTRGFNVRQPRLSPPGSLPMDGLIQQLKVVGHRAFALINGSSRLQVIDISNPGDPVRTNEVEFGEWARAFDLSPDGKIAYVLGDGLQVIDISNPADPVRLGQLEGDEWIGDAVAISVEGDRAAILWVDCRVIVYDISDPPRLKVLWQIQAPCHGNATDLHWLGGVAYVAYADFCGLVCRGSGGMAITHEDPIGKTANLDLQDRLPVGVSIAGDHAFLATSAFLATPERTIVGSLEVMDISNPHEVWHVASIGLPDPARDVQVVEDTVFIAGDGGLKTYRLVWGYPQVLRLELPDLVSFRALPISNVVTTSSGLPVTLSVVRGAARIEDGRLILGGLGSISLRAEQAGNEQFLPASAEWTFQVVLPELGIRLVDGQMEVSWAAGLGGLRLQSRESLVPDVPWQDMRIGPEESEGVSRVRLEPKPMQQFLRLFRP